MISPADAMQDNGLDRLRHMAMWSISENEVAREISEIDFINLRTLSGLVLQPGVTALVYVDGVERLQLDGGTYHFVSDYLINEQMPGKAARILEGFIRFIKGRKWNDQEADSRREREIEDIISKLNENSIIAIYLKRDISFQTYYGMGESADGRPELKPIKIRTKTLDADMALQASLRITDFTQFIKVFLAIKRSVSIIDIQKALEVYVRNVLQEELRSEEIDDYGISESARNRIFSRLSEMRGLGYGLELVRIDEIACSNEAIDRFRALTQELYCTEKELDFLHRTNEFENRLARENNAAKINSTKNDAELRAALADVNRDSLLKDDELHAFAMALAYKVFKRKTDDRTQRELLEIASVDETAKAKIASLYSLRLAQIEADEKIYEKASGLEMKKLEDERVRAKIKLDELRDLDEYNAGKEKSAADRAFEEQKRRMELALAMDEQAEEITRKTKREENEFARTIALDKYAHNEKMSAEQLIAEKAENLSEAWAGAVTSHKDEELYREKARLQEEYLAKLEREREEEKLRHEHGQDKLYDFLKTVVTSNAVAAGAQVEKMARTARDYREDAKYQQSRVDHTTDKALEYTTKATAAGTAKKKGQAVLECPCCGAEISLTDKVCGQCGVSLIQKD